MQRFLLRRFLQALFCLFAVSVLIFMLARLTGDPLDVMAPPDATREDYRVLEEFWGLDRPLYVQYGLFIANLVRGDAGVSYRWHRPVADLVRERSWATVQLAGMAFVVTTLIAVPLGVVTAMRKNTIVDSLGKGFAILGQALPVFWLGIVLMWVFAVQFRVLPTSGMGGLSNFILPAVTMGWYQAAAVMRLTRSAMLDQLGSEYVKLARGKGLPERLVVWKHCLRNAAITPLTYLGIVVGVFISGSVITETVFSWPGLGLLIVEAVRYRDFPVVQAVVLVFATVFITMNLIVDILYAYVDPRIRYA